MKLNKKLLNHIVVCMFALSAVTPISAMTVQRSGVLARAVARHSSLASKAAVSPHFQNASRVLQVSRTHTTTPHTTSLLQRPAFNMQSLVRGATRSRIPDAHARALNLVQRRSFSVAPLINSISTDAVCLAVSAAAAAITWYMDDGVPGGLKAACEQKDAQAVRQWLATHEMTAEEKMYVAHYCVKNGYRPIARSDYNGIDVYLALAEHVFAELIALRDEYTNQPKGAWFLSYVVRNNERAAKVFTPLAAQHFMDVVLADVRLLKDIINNYAPAAKVFTSLVAFTPAAAQDFVQAAEEAHIHDDMTLIFGVLVKQARGERLSPSEAHMLVHKDLILRDMLPKDVQDLQKKVLTQEHGLIDSGYVPLYHAQSKEKWFPITLDTFLHGVQTGEKVDEFYMMHTQADPLRQKAQEYVHEVGGQLSEGIMYNYLKAQDAAQRVRLRKYGYLSEADRQRMLFLNCSLRGNVMNRGSQSFPYYFVEDFNASGKYTQPQYIMQDIFKDRGLGSVYEQFKDELWQLHEEYIALSKYGTLYQLAVPEDRVNEMVRPVMPGGWATALEVYGETTDDMQKISAAMRDASNHPGDQNEFIATMTYDDRGLMNPQSGVKIKAYMIPNDDAQYAAWQAKWEDVKSRIKAAVESQRPADYVAPAHAQELVGLLRTAYEQRGGSK